MKKREYHGHAKPGNWSTTYRTWLHMLQRCNNPRRPGYNYYGGRGIKVCPEWSEFSVFLADMGDRPEGRTLERRDNDKGYSKDNCCWATNAEQHRNTSHNRWLTLNGKTLCLQDWASTTNIPRLSIHSRLQRGWSVEKALTTPLRPIKSGPYPSAGYAMTPIRGK